MCARERLTSSKLKAAFLALHTIDPNHSKTVSGEGEKKKKHARLMFTLCPPLYINIDQKHAAAYSFFSVHTYIHTAVAGPHVCSVDFKAVSQFPFYDMGPVTHFAVTYNFPSAWWPHKYRPICCWKRLKLDSFHNVFLCEGLLKGDFGPHLYFTNLLLTAFLDVAVSDPHDHSGGWQTERIPPNGHVQQPQTPV